ncbi:MAG TPA: amidase [Kiloniellales bacterium]|jgi:amidase|nr:amidase [Kiloniellales bacterium]
MTSDNHFPLDRDPLGAFLPGPRAKVPPLGIGPLNGLRVAVKDNFDLEGLVTGAGNPDFAASQQPARAHAEAVLRLLRAGASVVGKTITDELAYSLNGRNFHFGAPANPEAPGRICGGSSCGSASAVAGGLCDVALGTDTGGSVRVPASYCGLYGLRPTHDRIPLSGVVPLATSFDTVGWFAREPDTLEKVGEVLLGQDSRAFSFRRLLIAEDALEQAVPAAQSRFTPLIQALERRLAPAERLRPGDPEGLAFWGDCFRILQGREIRRAHGGWLDSAQPRFGEEIAERLAWTATLTDAQEAECAAQRAQLTARLVESLGDDGLLLLPSAPDAAPPLDADLPSQRDHRLRVLALTAFAGHAGLPQISLPLLRVDGCPLGLSLIAPAGADRALLAFARSFASADPTA